MNSISVFLGVPPRIPIQAQWATEKGKRDKGIQKSWKDDSQNFPILMKTLSQESQQIPSRVTQGD